jgi:hypothetical protein
MNENIKELLDKIYELQQNLADEIHQQGDELLFELKKGRITFAREIRERNKSFKIGIGRYIANARWLIIVTAPFIYSLILPFVILDIFVTIYQAVCFPVYRIPKVKRGDYLVFDRLKLDYLNAIEKFNCAFCSYCNGIVGYVREVAARTEQYWCPIKHAQQRLQTHSRYPKFTNFGDGEQYRSEHERLRKEI